jgi:hypothetical protein
MRHYYQTSVPDVAEPVYRRDPWNCHTAAMETLRQAGIEPPAEWSALLCRYADYIELGNHAIDRLIAHLVNPTNGADLTHLRANALVEEVARAGDDSSINGRVQEAVLRQLVASYATVAQRNYETVARRFNDVAKRFADYCRAVNVEGSPEALLAASPAGREAWLGAPSVSVELEETLRVLLAAAALNGARPDVAFVTAATDTETQEFQIGLACDPGKAHRRRVWEAWAAKKGRTGRWGALSALGVRLRAAKDPAAAAPYARPEQLRTVVNAGGRLESWDPHDGPLPPNWRPVPGFWQSETTSTEGVP